jgi:hypothetical protein
MRSLVFWRSNFCRIRFNLRTVVLRILRQLRFVLGRFGFVLSRFRFILRPFRFFIEFVAKILVFEILIPVFIVERSGWSGFELRALILLWWNVFYFLFIDRLVLSCNSFIGFFRANRLRINQYKRVNGWFSWERKWKLEGRCRRKWARISPEI